MATPLRITREKVQATIGSGMHTVAAARALQCNRRARHRAAVKFGIPLNSRQCRIGGKLEWQRLYLKYGPSLRGVAKAAQMNKTYVTQQLTRHGIIKEYDPAVRWNWAVGA